VAHERAISDVLQDILRSLQEIVRSEISLAKVEIRDDARQAMSSASWIAVGALLALSAWAFLLWTVTFALATLMSMWAATLLVAVVLAGVASVVLLGGIRRAKAINPIPERTIASIKENLEWMRHATK
jgi:hypothetical protein